MKESASNIVLALSFGKRKGNSVTNRANAQIAGWAMIFANLLKTIIVADASIPLEKMKWKGHSRIIGKGDPDTHESTLSLLKSAKFLYNYVGDNDKINIYIITAPPYMTRAVRDARKIFKETDVTIRGISIIGEEWFHKDSSQPYTTSKWLWWPREIFLRIMPLGFYSRISEWFDS